MIDLNENNDIIEVERHSDTTPAHHISLPAPSDHLLNLPATQVKSPSSDTNGAKLTQQPQQQLDQAKPERTTTTKRVRFDTHHDNNRKWPAYGSSSPDPLLAGLADNDIGAAMETTRTIATPAKGQSTKKPGTSQKRRRSSQIASRRIMAPLELFRRGGLDVSEDEASGTEAVSNTSRNAPEPLIEPLNDSQVKDSAGAKTPKRRVSTKASGDMPLSQHEELDQQTAAVKKQRGRKDGKSKLAEDDAKPKPKSRKSISTKTVDQSAP